MTAPALRLRRGLTVLLDTDLHFDGKPLRARRGEVARLSFDGCAHVCCCYTADALHEPDCPVDLPLLASEVIRAPRGAA